MRNRILFVTLGMIAIAFLTKACESRVRDADYTVAYSDVSQMLSLLGEDPTLQGNNTTGYNEFVRFVNEDPNASLYFSEAPGDFGPIETVMNLRLEFFNISNPVRLFAFFVVSNTPNGWLGALAIAGNAQLIGNQIQEIPDAIITDPSIFDPDFVRYAINNGQQNLRPGDLDETGFILDLQQIGNEQATFQLQSADVIDGEELSDVLQFDIWAQTTFGTQEYIGILNLVQPD